MARPWGEDLPIAGFGRRGGKAVRRVPIVDRRFFREKCRFPRGNAVKTPRRQRGNRLRTEEESGLSEGASGTAQSETEGIPEGKPLVSEGKTLTLGRV